MARRVIGYLEDSKIKYEIIPDDCNKCAWSIREGSGPVICEATGFIVGPGGETINVPERCPFPDTQEFISKLADNLRTAGLDGGLVLDRLIELRERAKAGGRGME